MKLALVLGLTLTSLSSFAGTYVSASGYAKACGKKNATSLAKERALNNGHTKCRNQGKLSLMKGTINYSVTRRSRGRKCGTLLRKRMYSVNVVGSGRCVL